MKTDTATIASAMDILARDIESGDGVANAAIREAAGRLRELERERDEVRHEIEGWRNKWNWAIEMAARAEMERDEAREIIRKAWVKFCEDGRDGQIAAEMFEILGTLKKEAK
jgi:hypothetical protein